MPCPYSGRSGDDGGDDRVSERREFLKAAVAIGGASAFSACLDREPSPSAGTEFYEDLEESPLSNRQHDFADNLVLDAHGNTVLPMHHSLLMLDYMGDEPPTDDERRRVETAFRSLESAYSWGVESPSAAGGPVLNEGLLFAVGYSPYYFERLYGETPPEPALSAEELVDELQPLGGPQEPSEPDRYDAFLYMTSDLANAVLGAEQALFGEVEEINGAEVNGGLDGVFTVRERRTGFLGRQGNIVREPAPHDNFVETKHADAFDDNPVPEDAELFMGFSSGFTDNLPPEDRVTIEDGAWEDGTVAQVSRTVLDLESWYQESHDDRVEMMFSPRHDKEQVGETGLGLASSSRVSEEMADAADEDAREHGVVGHSQKLAAARDEDFTVTVLRRDFNSTDAGEAGMEFVGFMQSIDDFVEMQEAMHGEHLDIEPERNGILEFFEVPSRATFLVPPRRLRALPPVEPS